MKVLINFYFLLTIILIVNGCSSRVDSTYRIYDSYNKWYQVLTLRKDGKFIYYMSYIPPYDTISIEGGSYRLRKDKIELIYPNNKIESYFYDDSVIYINNLILKKVKNE